MGALLGFMPFFAFAVVEKALGVVPGLACGALASIVLLMRDRLRGEHEVNILELGSAVMFAALAGMALADFKVHGGADWSVWRVRLWVDGGLVMIVLAGIALRRPFTLQHARRRVPAQVAASAAFMRTNYIISGAWSLAFAALALIDLLMLQRPDVPLWAAVSLTLAALAAAGWFTRWFPMHVKRRAARGRAATTG